MVIVTHIKIKSIKCNFVAYSYNHCGEGIISEDGYDEYEIGKDGVIDIIDNSANGFFSIIKENSRIDTYRPMTVMWEKVKK